MAVLVYLPSKTGANGNDKGFFEKNHFYAISAAVPRGVLNMRFLRSREISPFCEGFPS